MNFDGVDTPSFFLILQRVSGGKRVIERGRIAQGCAYIGVLNIELGNLKAGFGGVIKNLGCTGVLIF